jgi:DNA-binding PadR family transcriptional regulator
VTQGLALIDGIIDISPHPDNYVSMKLSKKQELIIDLLGQREMYGLDLIHRSGGSLRRGTIYVHLSRMEELDLIQGRRCDKPVREGCLPRRIYRTTEHGRSTFLTRHARLPVARAL